MKKIIVGIILVLIISLSACANNGAVEADLPSGFTNVSKDGTVRTFGTNMVIKHVDTGCHYMILEGDKYGGIVQMFVEKDGASVPYCE